jgi:hypothetical protein
VVERGEGRGVKETVIIAIERVDRAAAVSSADHAWHVGFRRGLLAMALIMLAAIAIVSRPGIPLT